MQLRGTLCGLLMSTGVAMLINCCVVSETAADASKNTSEAPEVYQLGELEIIDPWAKSALGSHDVKLFFEFRNNGDRADRLLAVDSAINDGPNRIIAVEVHNNQRSLREIPMLDIPADDHVFELSEIGYYLELRNIHAPLLMGSKFFVDLDFESAGRLSLEFAVRFHSPKLTRRIREAARSGDIEALKALRPVK